MPEPFSMQHVQDQMLLDIPELLEATNKISDFWKSTSIESVSADALVSMDEVTKYYCEEPWLMESTPVTRTNHAGTTAAPSSGMKLGIPIAYCRPYYS